MLTHGISPAFCDGSHYTVKPPSGQSRVYQVTQLCTNGVHCRQSAGTGPVVLEAVRVTSACFSGSITMDQLLCASLSRHPLLEQGTCAIQKMSEAFLVCYIIYIMYKDNDGVLPVVLLLARPLPYYASILLLLC